MLRDMFKKVPETSEAFAKPKVKVSFFQKQKLNRK